MRIIYKKIIYTPPNSFLSDHTFKILFSPLIPGSFEQISNQCHPLFTIQSAFTTSPLQQVSTVIIPGVTALEYTTDCHTFNNEKVPA